MVERVILIYDDESAGYFVNAIKERSPNYLCLPYSDAEELMQEIEAGLRFDLFLTDLAVEPKAGQIRPSISGEDLGKKVKELHPSVPIITISGFDYKPHFSRMHIEKPVLSDKIVSAIDSLLK